MTRLPDRFLADLGALVRAESKTSEVQAVTRCAEVLVGIAARVLGPGASLNVLPTASGPVLQWRLGAGPARLALIGHYDTVHPLGTLEQFPFRVSGDRAFGPGTYDMKAGLLTLLHAAATVRDPDCRDGLVIHLCPDEEEGSAASLPMLEALVADGLQVALVFEGAGPGGAVYTARKSGMWLTVDFQGTAAHASRPQEGANALEALLRFGTDLLDLHHSSPGTTVVATRAAAGDAINSAPGRAQLTLDCRTLTVRDQDRIWRTILERAARLHPVHADVRTLHRFPPLPVASSEPVFEAVVTAAKAAGLLAPAAATGYGISDASHVASLGVLVLDGLGPAGGEDHSPREWVDLSTVSDRITLVAESLPSLTSLARHP